MKKIIRWFYREYIKFVKGQCRHICRWCVYNGDCLPHFLEDYKK